MTRIAVIGAGHWGKNLIQTLYKMGELAAIADSEPVRYEAISALYPDVPIYQSYLPLLKSNIPAVAIATPVSTHYKIAREALLAGKDVFVEKPITLSVSDGEELVKLAAVNGKLLMTGHLLLYQPAVQSMKKIIGSGKIGQLYSLHQRRAKLGRVRSVENVLWSFGVHDIAVLLYLIGSPPEQLAVSAQSMLQPDIEDDVYLHLTFPGNMQAHLHTSWLWPEQERRLIAIGSQGMLIYDETKQLVTLHHKGIEHDLSNRNTGSEIVFEGDQQPLKLELNHFLDCISTRQAPLSDGKSGVNVIGIIDEAMRMLKGGDG